MTYTTTGHPLTTQTGDTHDTLAITRHAYTGDINPDGSPRSIPIAEVTANATILYDDNGQPAVLVHTVFNDDGDYLGLRVANGTDPIEMYPRPCTG